MSMTESLVKASIAGALVPLFWGVMSFLLFNLNEGVASRIFWAAVHLSCPFWVIEGSKALVLMPLFNPLLYGCLTALFLVSMRKLRN